MTAVDLSTSMAKVLAHAGGDTVFGLPGGGNNLDFIGAAEAAGLRFVLAHAESSAAIMAAVYGDLTGRPVACLVTRGPGAASAVNGVANALLDRQQLVLVTDAVGTADYKRIAHQRIDQCALFTPVTKWSGTVGTDDATSTTRRAVALSMSEPGGPVHLNFDPSGVSTALPLSMAYPEPESGDLLRLAEILTNARRPLVLLGLGARRAVGAVRALLSTSRAPVLMTYRAKGIVPDSWPIAAGLFTGATSEAPLLESADLIVMIGVDSVELIPSEWPYAAAVVKVGAWRDASPYVTPEVEAIGELGKLVAHLAANWPSTDWELDAGRRHREREVKRLLAADPATAGGISPQLLVQRTRAAAPVGSTATVDAGAHMFPSMCLWDVEDADQVLISSGLATMGFAVPAAIGAALARPGRRIVCFTGDGGLGMSLGELETISRLDLPVTVVVFNDSRLSLIALKAKSKGNGGAAAVEYVDTDFAAVGRGYGIAGQRITTVEELDAGLAASFARPGATLLDVRVDPAGYPAIVAAIRGPR